jgi:hypothetical protein
VADPPVLIASEKLRLAFIALIARGWIGASTVVAGSNPSSVRINAPWLALDQ